MRKIIFRSKRKFIKLADNRNQDIVSPSKFLISIGIKYFPVRLSGDMPEFEGLMTINKFGECSIVSPEFKINPIKMFGWYLNKNLDDSYSLEIQITGKFFRVLPASLEKANTFLSENFPELKDKRYPE